MYQLNRVGRNVLITPSEVIAKAGTTHTLDPLTIEKSIEIAEEEYIRSALGFDFYEALIAQKNLLIVESNVGIYQAKFGTEYTLIPDDVINAVELPTMSAASRELWNMYLWKLCAECVMAVALPNSYVQFKSEGAVHTNPVASPIGTANVITPSLSSMKWAVDQKMKSRIDPLMEAMHQWLCKKNAATLTTKPYPLYTRPCDCDKNGVPYKRKTDLILTMYDDSQPCGCDWDPIKSVRHFDEETGTYN